jgi:outer membrane protein assembly factor BamB
VYALDRDSGATRWVTQANPVALTHLWSSPVVADGVVMIGIAGRHEPRPQPLPPEVINTVPRAVVGIDAQSGACCGASRPRASRASGRSLRRRACSGVEQRRRR